MRSPPTFSCCCSSDKASSFFFLSQITSAILQLSSVPAQLYTLKEFTPFSPPIHILVSGQCSCIIRLFLRQPRCIGDQHSIIERDWKYTLISLSCHHFPFGSLTPRQAYSVPKSYVISISFRISILLKTRLSQWVVTQQFLFCDALSHVLITVFMHAEHFLESLFGTTSD